MLTFYINFSEKFFRYHYFRLITGSGKKMFFWAYLWITLLMYGLVIVTLLFIVTGDNYLVPFQAAT